MLKLLIPVCLILLPVVVTAGDDTLRFYLEKSDIVFVAEALDGDGPVTGRLTISEARHVLNQGNLKFKVLQTIKGRVKADQVLEIPIDTPNQEGDRQVLVKKGERYILFLTLRTAL